MMIQIHQKSIPTAQLQHRLVQGESNIEKVVFFVPSVPNVDFSELIFTIKLLAEDAGKIVIGELDTDPTENGILLSWDVAKKYTRYGGSTRLQIDGADATGNIVYKALSEKFCMRKELTGEDAVQDPEPDPEAGYVPPIESGDNGKYLRAMNGEAIWGEIDHPKEIFWVELDTSAMKCSHSPTEILEAVNKGLFIMGRNTTTNSRYYCTGVDTTFAAFEGYSSRDEVVYGETCPGFLVFRYVVTSGKDLRYKPSYVLSHKKLPNPFPLEFEGAVIGSYDGSVPMKIKIPTGGSVGGEKEIFWVEFDSETKMASHSPEEMMEAYAKGYLIVGRYDNCFYNLRFLNSGTAILCYTTVTYNVFDGEPLGVASEYRLTISQDKSFTHGVFMFKEPKKLPSPFSLNFSGAATGSYDGSSETNIRIPEIPKSPVQSDWYVNDENDLAYIKNRTHWADGLEEIVPITEGAVQEGGLVFGVAETFIAEGETYVVKWNGVDYTLTAKRFAEGEISADYIGNFALADEDGEDTGEPFVVFSTNGETGCVTSSNATTVTFGLSKVTGIHPLAESFIPETIARKNDIPDVPDKIPNPNALTFSGAVTETYDGSEPKEIKIPEAKEYTLPVASETALGGVKASAKTEDMTQPVGIGEDGFLFTAPGASGEKEWKEAVNITLEEEVNVVDIPIDWSEWEECMFFLNFVAPTTNPLTSAGTVKIGEGMPYTSAVRPIGLDGVVPTSGSTTVVVISRFYHDLYESGHLDMSFSVHKKRRDTSSSVTHSMWNIGGQKQDNFVICANGKNVYFGVGTSIRIFAR